MYRMAIEVVTDIHVAGERRVMLIRVEEKREGSPQVARE